MTDTSEAQQQANMLSARDRLNKPRHRASVACSACRDRRTRCVVPAGERYCTQCRDAGQECIIKHDDERRKPNSKAYVNSLRERIAHLESLLEVGEQRELEHRSPVSQQPSFSSHGLSHEVAIQQEPCQSHNTDSFDFATSDLASSDFPPFPSHDTSLEQPQPQPQQQQQQHVHSPANSAHSNTSSNKSTMVHRLLSTKGHLSFDQLSGRLRYYGPTTNFHVYSELAAENEEHNRQALEQRRRTQRVLSTLPQETQDYLMQAFWQYYNSVIHVIHQAAFEQGLHDGQGQFYSPFLHICILAIGYRHADKSRPDIMKISLPGKESTLHREAKYMLDYELERPGGVTSVQALLLLGDLECGVGRDNLGWLISGMANRLCFDIGLHLDNSASGLSQLEVEIGRMTLWACVIYDRYWALFLGRPTALKPQDLEVYRLAQQFERLGTLEPAGPSKNLEKQIYEALLDLMELAGKITEIMDKASKPNANFDHHVYITMAALNRELETWYTRLPCSLQWLPENIAGAPFSYFLLHQQYHSAIILLHRQFAQYDDVVPNSGEPVSDISQYPQVNSHFATLSRMTCTRSAGRMAQIFWQHRQQYETKKIFVTGLQHAGTAAIALIAAIASPKDRVSCDTNMRYLECLAASIDDMCETYQPAERMSAVLNAVLAELKAAWPPQYRRSTVPARRDSSTDRDIDDGFLPAKRHQSNRPDAQRNNSHISETPVFLSEHHRRHTTTGMRPPTLSTFRPQNESSKETSHVSSSADSFVLVPADPEGSDQNTGGWPKFDDPNPFLMDDTPSMPGLGRPASPSQFLSRSAWMGAETPTFSPMPTDASATNLAGHMTSAAERQSHSTETQQPHNFFSSNSNLDFMTLLNGSEHSIGTIESLSNNTNSTNNTNSDQFSSLPTPIAQTSTTTNLSISLNKKSTTHEQNTRSQTRHRSSSRAGHESTYDEDQGFSRTMAGLDGIWKEMLRSNQSSGTTSGKR